MKLSIVIVNYNVEHFLEQCLISVRKAIDQLDAEVFVVDNNSVDGSVSMIKNKFKDVKLIANKENVGFSSANNQAIKLAQGEYVLLLNPDTVVEEDTFLKCIQFMDNKADSGGLGVKMIDGKGKFLPESKRGLPTPSVAFFKIFGLSSLFPKSKVMGRYHLGFLAKNKNHSIEILSGAFMLLRKKALDKIGLLDESFFMYGEDIDLSYRLILGGYKNYYFSETSIIHYKGESTKKTSINYVFVFYNAMIIFAKKHFSKKNAKLFSFFINIAIYIRAFIAISNQFLKKLSLTLFDTFGTAISIYFIAKYYQIYTGITFPLKILSIALIAYTFIWVVSNVILGANDKPYKLFSILKAATIGTIIILSAYALLPKEIQFSRSIILLSSIGFIGVSFLNRIAFHLMGWGRIKTTIKEKKSFAIVGSKDEGIRIKNLLEQIAQIEELYFVNPSIIVGKDETSFNIQLNQLNDLVRIKKIHEVVFCAKDISAQSTIEIMSTFSTLHKVDFKISQPNTLFLIGSNSIHSSGDLYMVDMNTINNIKNIRAKRLFDLSSAILLISIYPLLFLFIKHPLIALKNILSVLIGLSTWVGYYKNTTSVKLPKLKNNILSVSDGISPINDDIATKLNVVYAKDYSIIADLRILIRNLKFLG
ncbi:MAG: glycosyltransferase [Flavobacteriales bacterium]|nr:glycosyltransferase [Flavobacteriales bacterium]